MDRNPDRPSEVPGDDPDFETSPAEKPEKVEDRPNVSTVTPEDYPPDQRAGTFNKSDRP